MSRRNGIFCRAAVCSAALPCLMSALVALPSCMTAPRTGAKPGKPAPKVSSVPAVEIAYAQKDEITEGEELEIKLHLITPDSGWQVLDPKAEVSGNTITVRPRMAKPRGDTSTAIASQKKMSVLAKDLKAGSYTVIVVNRADSKNIEFQVAVKPKK